MKISKCRMCKSEHIEEYLDLGTTALADNFLVVKQLNDTEGFSLSRGCRT